MKRMTDEEIVQTCIAELQHTYMILNMYLKKNERVINARHCITQTVEELKNIGLA